MKEVAELAGVSQMTVSRVINSPDKVKAATAARVRDAIAQLNYRPNPMAQGLAGGGSVMVGLLFNNPSINYLGEVLLGALRGCRDRNHQLVVDDYFNAHQTPDFAALAEHLRQIGLDAVIICPPLGEDDGIRQALEAEGIICVWVSPGKTVQSKLAVRMDDEGAAFAMTSHLIKQGHKRVGFIRGPDDHSATFLREQGYRRAIEEHGLTPSEDLIAKGHFTYRGGMIAARKLLVLDQPPTAIFASNDDMAAGAIASALRLGHSVPEDVSVAGFDDTPLATSIWPTMTTVRQPISGMAEQAVHLIDELLHHNTDEKLVTLDYKICERESTRPLLDT